MIYSWLCDKAESRLTEDRGHGTFARSRIEKDEIIAVWGGDVMPLSEVIKLPLDRRANSLQIGDDTYLVPKEPGSGDFVNHSCAPNAGIEGDRALVAMRTIETGEEITYDYAMTDSSSYDEFECRCGALCCRGRISGSDWNDVSLRDRYQGYFSSYLEKLIQKRA